MVFQNVFYQNYFNIIGGIETFLFELAKLSNKYQRDFTIVYRSGNEEQIERLKRYCWVYKLDEIEKPIKCKKAFFNYNIDAIDYFEAEEYIQIVHADFKSDILKDWIAQSAWYDDPRITATYAVSKNNAKSYKEIMGKDIPVLYNPIVLEDEPRVMTLVSAQRLSPEKGGKRIERMIQELDDSCLPYVWHIFSDQRLSIESPNVMYHKVNLSVRNWLKHADYTVLLSDTEGFPYTAYESLCLGTPLIITKLPMLPDLGADETNSIQLDFDMSNLDVKDIHKKAGTFKFDYKPKPDGWLKLLEGKSTFVYTEPKSVKVIAKFNYYDTKINKWIMMGDVYEVLENRAAFLMSKGAVDLCKE